MRCLAAFCLLSGLLTQSGDGAEPATPVNLINNPSLEGLLLGNGLPDGWYASLGESSRLSAYTLPVGHSGERSLRIQSTGDWGSVLSPVVELRPAEKQSAEVWYRTIEKSAGQIRMYINYLDKDRQEIGHSPVRLVELSEADDSTGWKRLSVEHFGSRVAGAQAFCLVVALVKPGVALFDDFALYQVAAEEGTPLAPNGDMELPTDELNKVFPFGVAEGGAAQLTSDHENPHGGNASMRLTGKAKWVVMKLVEVDLTPGQTVQGSAWKRGNLGGAHFRLIGKGPKGQIFEKYLSYEAKRDWEETKWKLTPDELGEATAVRFDIEAHGEFDVFFDDVAISVE